jgi:glycerophosphoryl diester phosphodiesterase
MACALSCASAGRHISLTAPAAQTFPTPFHIIAHRGASAQAPENTLPAFQLARESGAFEVELDVQISADDVVVMFHDKTLDLKTNMSGRVRDHAAANVLQAEIGTWFDASHPEIATRYAGTRLGTLAELFEAHGRELYYHIEIKAAEPEIPGLVLAEVERFGLLDRAIITSFYFEQLVRARELDDQVPLALLILPGGEIEQEATPSGARAQGTLLEIQKLWIDAARAAKFQMVAIAARDVSLEIVAYARRNGLELRAWAIGGDEDMERAIALGCAGMTTNWPERLIRRLVEHAGAGSGS